MLQHLDPELFNGYIIHLKNNKFTALVNEKEIAINKRDFTFQLTKKLISFDAVFMALHGPPTENGIIQPYFDNLNIPYSACNSTISALTFDKYRCNNKLNKLGFNCAKSYIYKTGDKIDAESIIKNIGLPCFVKPNGSGSSYGISKVKQKSDLEIAINHALDEELTSNIKMLVYGQDIADGKGGVFTATKGLSTKHGSDRVFNAPLAESSIVGTAIGLSLCGYKPVVEIQFGDYIWTAMMQIRNELATIRYRSNNIWELSLIHI